MTTRRFYTIGVLVAALWLFIAGASALMSATRGDAVLFIQWVLIAGVAGSFIVYADDERQALDQDDYFTRARS